MPIIIPPGRSEAVFRSLCYLMLGAAGVWGFFAAPVSVQGEIGGRLTIVWGASLITSLAAAVAAFMRRYRVEYMALPLVICGVAIFAYTIWAQVPRVPTMGAFALVGTAVTCALLGRLVTLHRLVYSWKGGPWTGSAQ